MKRTINLYSKIKYLTVLFLILIFLLQICIFSNEKFYYHYEVINDGSFENVIEINVMAGDRSICGLLFCAYDVRRGSHEI